MLFNTKNRFYHLFRAMRPRQWVKNLVVFAPIVFSGDFFNGAYIYEEIQAFIFFSLAASAVYLINDIVDAPKDRKHPIKKNRPIAAGVLPVKWAVLTSIIIITVFVPASFFIVGKYYGIVLIVYLVLQIIYTIKLKNIIIIDALTISVGFILRVFAGALSIPVSISSWLILTVIGGSLLLAFGKRRAERTLLEAKDISKESTRNILGQYPDTLLDSMISMSAAFAIISYSLFTFQVSPEQTLKGAFEYLLPSTLIGAKVLMMTIPIVIYGVGRYLYVIYEKREGESPERVLFQDKPLLTTAIIEVILVVLLINGTSLIAL